MCKLLHFENTIFTEARLRLFSWVGIAVFLLLVTLTICKLPWPFLPGGRPTCIDFGFFWLSGKLAVAGDTARIFDFPAWSAFQESFFGPGNCINFNRFYYPPTLLFITYPLGLMPYGVALAMWFLATFALYEAAIYAIIPHRVALLAAITPIVVIANIMLGQNGLYTAGLMGLSLVFLERRRPWTAGIFLGLLTYKPHFGLLFPIALLASRNWRAIGSTVLITVVLGVLAAIAFGLDGWTQFIGSLSDRTTGLGPAANVEMKLQSVIGVFQRVGVSARVSWIAQGAMAIITTVYIWILWSKPVSYNLKAAALCAGLFLVSPYALFYDLSVFSLAVGFFVKEGLERGFLPGERVVIVICWVMLLFGTWRSGPVVSAIIVLLIARQIAYTEACSNTSSSKADTLVGGDLNAPLIDNPKL